MRNKIISSLLVTVASCLVNTSALASPIVNNATFTCPAPNVLSNFGDYVAGPGSEVILDQTNPIYFQTTQYPAGIPASLFNYSNSGTAYNMVTGYVTCNFTSSDPSENAFNVSYHVTNGKGGLIQSQDNSTISIAFPVGLRS